MGDLHFSAIAIVCEDEEQLAKIVEIREHVPTLRTVIVIDSADAGSESARALGAITLDEVRERGRGRDPQELAARRDAVTLEDPFTFIYTSGTTGPPKGCVLSHGNYRAVVDMVNDAAELETGETIYRDLPLAHAYALLIQLAADPLAAHRLLRRRHEADRPRADGGQTDVPAVGPPRVREDYTLARGAIDAKPEEERRQADAAIALGFKVRTMTARGEEIPD